mmetsp:Transcript_1419/g.3367  ORF Transcript_1419/g.3367 Transcript_1419/m.3367 type:complete len:235 (+) Transcript_1419:1256-1960(+)
MKARSSCSACSRGWLTPMPLVVPSRSSTVPHSCAYLSVTTAASDCSCRISVSAHVALMPSCDGFTEVSPVSMITCELFRMSHRWSITPTTSDSVLATTCRLLTTCSLCGTAVFNSSLSTGRQWWMASVRTACSVPFIVFSSLMPFIASSSLVISSGTLSSSCAPFSRSTATSAIHVPDAEVSSTSVRPSISSSRNTGSSWSTSISHSTPASVFTAPNCVCSSAAEIRGRISVSG